MRDIFAAASDATANYELQSKGKKVATTCQCRGKCGTHTGPCTMKADGPVGNSSNMVDMPASAGKIKMCKPCSVAFGKKKK